MKFKASKLFVVSIVAAFGMAMGLACEPLLAEDKPQPMLKEITMVGNKEIPAYEIARFFEGQLSRPIDRVAVATAIEKAEDLYIERGFVLAKITRVEDAPKGELKLVIDEGILDAIEILGNKKTKGFIIRNNVRLKPGSAYNERQVSSDLRKLFANGYFTDIMHSVVSSEKSPGKFILKIEVAEKRSGSVNGCRGAIDSLPLPANSIDPYGDDATGPSKVDSLFYRNMLSTSASVTPGTRDAIIDATQGSYLRFPKTPTAGPGAILSDDSAFNGFVKIVADRTEYDLEKNTFLGTGNAVAIIGGQNSKLEADTLLYDQAREMIDARGNVKILRNGQLTTGAAFKFKVSSDEYLITHPETSVEGTQLISRTDCPGKVITIFKTPKMALASSEQFSENVSCGFGKLLADKPPLFPKNQGLAKLYRTAATTNNWFLFGRPVDGQLTCLAVNPAGVGNDRYGIRAFINPRANVDPNRIHLNAGHTQAPILSGDVKMAKWLRIVGNGSYKPSSFRPNFIKNRFGFDVLRGVPSPNLVVDIPKRAIGYRDGRPVAEGPHTKFSEDTPHTEQSWTY